MDQDEFKGWLGAGGVGSAKKVMKVKKDLKLKKKRVVAKNKGKDGCGVNPKTGRCKKGETSQKDKCTVNTRGNCAKKK